MLAALVVDTLTSKRDHFRFLYTSHYLLNRRTIFGFLSDFSLSLYLPHSTRNAIDRSDIARGNPQRNRIDPSTSSSLHVGRVLIFPTSEIKGNLLLLNFFRYFVRFQLIGGRHLLYVVSYIDQREILQQLTV